MKDLDYYNVDENYEVAFYIHRISKILVKKKKLRFYNDISDNNIVNHFIRNDVIYICENKIYLNESNIRYVQVLITILNHFYNFE